MKTVIIPTLNEEENISKLISSIYHHLDVGDTTVIVVDDDSLDRTQEIIEAKSEEFRTLKLIVRKNEKGLSTAVRRGATEAPSGPVVTMDADFSHHPRFLPAMFSKLEEGYDIVVGSRYVQGGQIEGWPGSRIAVSKIATMLARVFLRVPVKDPMSGFVGVRAPHMLIDNIEYADYKFLIELLAKNRLAKVTEVPITFRDRMYGESKLGSTTILRYLFLVIRLLFEEIVTSGD